MGSLNRIVSGVLWSTIVNIVNGIYGFISVPILIEHFGKAEYGLIGLAMSINIYLQLMDMGFNTANLRFYSSWLAKGKLEKMNRLFQSSLSFYSLVGIVNILILFVISLYSGQLFGLPANQIAIMRQLIHILMANAFVSWISGCFDQLIKSTENVAWCQKRALLPKAIQVTVLFCTVYFNFSITIYFLLTSLAIISTIPLSVRKIRVELPSISFIPRLHWPVLKETLPYCLNIFSFGIFQFSFYNLRPVFLGIQGSIESVADYRILNGIVAIVTIFSNTFMSALLPSSAKVVARDDKDAFYRIAYSGTKYLSIVCSFCCFGMIAISKEVISLYVGDSFLYLVPWLNLWLLCTLVSHNQAISSLILSGIDIKPVTYSTAGSSLVGLMVAWLLIPEYQIGGVVIAFGIYVIMQLLFYYLYYWPRKMKIDSWKVFSKSFAPAVVIGCFPIIIGSIMESDYISTAISLIVKASLFFVFFAIGTYMFFTREDRMFISKSILSRFTKKGNR